MSSVDENPAVAGWYPEPGNQGVLRYWNGSGWEDWRQPAVAAPAAPANGIAVTALVFSLVGIALDMTILLGILGFGASVVGIVCGRIGVRRSAALGRRGMALWGFWLGVAAVALQVLLVVVVFALRASQFGGS